LILRRIIMSADSITLWKQRIEGRKASGLKVDEWCNQNQISRHAYYYWYRKIKDTESEQKSIPVFAEVLANNQIQEVPSRESGISITWKDISITVNDRESIELAADLIRCLRSQC